MRAPVWTLIPLVCLIGPVLCSAGPLEDERTAFYSMTPPELPAALREAVWKLEPIPKAPPELDGLIQDLGAEWSAERRVARERILAIGLPAGSTLLKWVRDEDPERALQARSILRSMTREHVSTRVLQLLVVEALQSQTDSTVLQLLGDVPAQEVGPLSHQIFSLRHMVSPDRLIALLSKFKFSEDARETLHWYLLVGHHHGAPLFMHPTRFPNSAGLRRGDLTPGHIEYLKRASTSAYPRLRRHAHAWSFVLGLDLATEPAAEDLDALSAIAALRLYGADRAKREVLRTQGLRLMESSDPIAQARGLDWYGIALQGIPSETRSSRAISKEDLAPFQPFLKHERPELRLRAAFAMLPLKAKVKEGDNTRYVSFKALSSELLRGTDGAALAAVADWLDSATEEAPLEAGAYPGYVPGYGAKVFSDLQSVCPEASQVLRRIAVDLQAAPAADRAARLRELARGIGGTRFLGLAPREWPAPAFEDMLELAYATKGATIYPLRETYLGRMPEFLPHVFQHGPVPDKAGYSILATAAPTGRPELLAALKASLAHPSLGHRVEAVSALAFLRDSAALKPARAILADTANSETLRSRAAVALAELEDEASYPNILAGFTRLTNDRAGSDYVKQLALARYLYSSRHIQSKAVREHVVLRVRTGRCQECMAKSSACGHCVRDAESVAALALHWNLAKSFPTEWKQPDKHPIPLFRQIQFMSEPAAFLPTGKLQSQLRVPAARSVDLSLATARKVDEVTKGATAFAEIQTAAQRIAAVDAWRKTREAIPFLPPSDRESATLKLTLELEHQEQKAPKKEKLPR